MTKRLFAILRYTMVAALMASTLVFTSCDKDEDAAPTQTLYELISADPSLSKIKAQIDLNADLKAKLQGSGNYTFFAPNDLAMNAILTTLGLTDFSSISPGTLSVVLNYHIVDKAVMASEMTSGTKIKTVQGEDITVNVTGTGSIKLVTGATTNGTVITSDIKGTNGVLHVVGDYPLVPPTVGGLIVATLGKVSQPILLSSSFTVLASAILKADAGKPANETIVGLLSASPDITFFAPPDGVFTAAGIDASDYSAAEWNAIIRGHIVASRITTLENNDGITAVNGGTLVTTATTVKGGGNANAINVVTAGKVTVQNGVIWPIQGIIVHP